MLSTKILNVAWVEKGAKFMVNNLVLFFIPATVGIMNYFDLFAGKGFLLVVIVLFSTLLVMVSSGKMSQWVMRRREREHG